jgi:transposase
MLEALLNLLRDNSTLHLDEMAIFVWDTFDELLSPSTISRSLKRAGWSKKVARRIAQEQNADLRDMYQYDLSEYEDKQVVYVDETGCDKRAGYRRMGWSPFGVTPVQVARFQRGQRYHILPAYTCDGILHARIYQGTTDSTVFEDFIAELLSLCGRWPEPYSVLIMDNASFHRGERVRQMCEDAGVKLLYLPPYSPDFNPVEEWFAQFKACVKKHFGEYPHYPHQDFGEWLRWVLDTIGRDRKSARGHFRHAGWKISEP